MIVWFAFIALVMVLLAIDIGVFQRGIKGVSLKVSLVWTAVWIGAGLAFSVPLAFAHESHWQGLGLKNDPVDGAALGGSTAALRYLTGYVIEKSLSVDNIFVIAMIFAYFGIPSIHQRRVLYWGILGAIVLRGGMILAGAKMVEEFHWVLYIFAAILVVAAVRMLWPGHGKEGMKENAMVRFARKLFPVSKEIHGERFFVRENPGSATGEARLMLTPTALALVMVETSDVFFAVDSIPAIFVVTADPFIVFTSNIFAILGLRSLYFVLAGFMDKFRYLNIALAVVLLLVGAKILATKWIEQMLGQASNAVMLAAVGCIIASGVIASIVYAPRDGGEK